MNPMSGREPLRRDVEAQRGNPASRGIVLPVHRQVPVTVVQQVNVVATPIFTQQPQPHLVVVPQQPFILNQQDARGNRLERLVVPPGNGNNPPPPVYAKSYGIMPPPPQY